MTRCDALPVPSSRARVWDVYGSAVTRVTGRCVRRQSSRAHHVRRAATTAREGAICERLPQHGQHHRIRDREPMPACRFDPVEQQSARGSRPGRNVPVRRFCSMGLGGRPVRVTITGLSPNFGFVCARLECGYCAGAHTAGEPLDGRLIVPRRHAVTASGDRQSGSFEIDVLPSTLSNNLRGFKWGGDFARRLLLSLEQR